MIIVGTRGVKWTLKEGQFNCPQCEKTTNYRHRSVRRFFTLYFIPIIPLDKLGEYVECRNCKGTFVPNILNMNSMSKDQFLATYEKAIHHTMVLTMLADGIIDENEKLEVLAIINKFGHNDMTMEQLMEYTKQVQKENEDVSTYLKKIAGELNEQGKETIIKCALSVAASDGDMDPTEMELIKRMSESLQMKADHVKRIFEEMFETKELNQ
ncbi:MAG: TerB family tellurite resistance protein [Chitinophagales bacterium]